MMISSRIRRPVTALTTTLGFVAALLTGCVIQPPQTEGCGTTGDVSLVGGANTEKAFWFFVQQGFKDFQSAGIIGNMVQESGVNPLILQDDQKDHKADDPAVLNTGGGWGLVQWTPARKFVKVVMDHGVPAAQVGSLAYQLKVVNELIHGRTIDGYSESIWRNVASSMKATTSVEQATSTFMNEFERPAAAHANLPRRTSVAKQILAQFGGKEPPSGPTPSSAAPSASASASGSASATGSSAASSAAPTSGGGDCGGDGTVPGKPLGKSMIPACDSVSVPAPESDIVAVPGSNARVHKCMLDNTVALFNAAKSAGYGGLSTVSSSFRSHASQIQLRIQNCGGSSHYNIYEKPSNQCNPNTARPGSSNHEAGVALDLQGTSFGNPLYNWLVANGPKYGFVNLVREADESWHWGPFEKGAGYPG